MRGVTMHFALVEGDNRVHVLSDGSNGEWKLACGTKWFVEIVPQSRSVYPTCLACIVEDARWWAQFL